MRRSTPRLRPITPHQSGATDANALRGTLGAESFSRPLDDFRGPADAPPYDVEVVRPRAIDIRKLYALVGKPLPDDIQATLGPKRPLLLCHGLTPFHRPGTRVSSVWGLGYEAQLSSEDGATVASFPGSQTIQVGNLEQSVQVGVGAGGALDVPKEALQIANALPGIKITGAELSATTSSHLALALSLTLTLRSGSRPRGSRWRALEYLSPKGTSRLLPATVSDAARSRLHPGARVPDPYVGTIARNIRAWSKGVDLGVARGEGAVGVAGPASDETTAEIAAPHSSANAALVHNPATLPNILELG